jgi:hypothetical protein
VRQHDRYHHGQSLEARVLAEVNPIEYLADLLPRLARGTLPAHEFSAMLPDAWKAVRATGSADGM